MITLNLDNGRELPIHWEPSQTARHQVFRGDKLVKVRLFGRLARVAGRELYELAICSVREVITALHYLTDARTTRYIDRTSDTVRWRILVNGQQLDGDSPGIGDELLIERQLETIDIYPVMEGAGSGFLGLILGAILIVVGIVLFAFGGFALTGLGLVGLQIALAGVASALSGLLGLMDKPSSAPKQKKTQNNPSYLFAGTVNVQDQGGPVPVCYGNVIIGSQTISAAVRNSDLYGIMGPTSGVSTGNTIPYALTQSHFEPQARAGVYESPQTYADFGPLGMWGKANGVSIMPTTADIPTEQHPHAVYPTGPWWMILFDNGGLGANYMSSGANGPWECLWTSPSQIEPIIVTQKVDWYIDFAPTPHLP